ncbi:4'-phosphopantetheinyl transferase [Micromonospora halophytica]|uniref:4'-phosphopantetheinyl transferase n=1 Tax=Micromonospora halophytica TaxID=47864 RepID=A0A1C5HGR1_9ACTN|nr:4'-phosphopantetheinyl transferase [Micromonospora halophytica]
MSGQDTVHVWVGRTAGGRPEVARRLLRRAGSALLGRVEREVVVGHGPDGRPRVRAGAAVLPVSVSHGDGVVVVAARRAGAVGVDVERRRRLPAVALARRWYAPQEVAWLSGLPEDARADGFLLLWTAKEAVGKALGRGLRDGGLRRRMPVPDHPRSLLRPVPQLADVRVGHPPCPDGLVLAVAVAAPVGEVTVLLG